MRSDMSDQLARLIMDDTARKTIESPVQWGYRNNGDLLRSDTTVSNAHGLPVTVVMLVHRSKPWGPTLILLHRTSGANIRRLDVRGGHRNMLTDQRAWTFRTHLHIWSEAYGNKHAEDPHVKLSHEDESFPAVPADEYRQVFEEFCSVCGVSLGDGYEWCDPPPFEEDELILGGEIP